ncbi:VOC family protein [Candidatus Entotheonella palauensis]|uniref:VOC family protein n=1 Tax=Candidatus Entotheonella palauensis TaxID=93172 RepID=UPI000B7E51F6|nr:VOC family protein [Candidatus Entotheonella palauensis]
MLGHLGINVSDLERAKTYYAQLMPFMGFELYRDDPDQFAYRRDGGQPGTYLYFYPALEASHFSRHHTGLQHLAFVVPSRDAVHAVHTKAQELGSEVIHPPQEFPQYQRPLSHRPPGYYATFWLDPDGIMLECVCHRPDG